MPFYHFAVFVIHCAAKFAALEDAGVYISRSPAQLGATMVRAFEERGMAI